MSAVSNAIPQPPRSTPPTSTAVANAMPVVTAAAAAVGASTTPPTTAPIARGLFDLRPADEAPENELLRNRFLSRKGSLVIVGNTGIGKSSLVMQMMIQWALGAGCFGINPARPLKSLLVQGENDEQDMAEMRDGVAGSLQLNENQRAIINRSVVVCHEVERTSEEFAVEVLERLIIDHEPDLVWIDPVFQYLGGDSNQQEVVSSFLRQQLGSVLKRHQCALVLIHHTNKPSKNGARNNANPNLRAYDGAGSAEFSNWPRAMLSLQAVPSNASTYKLIATKRGARLGWMMPDGTTPSFIRTLTHSRRPGVIFWEDAADLAAAAGPNQPANIADGQQQQQPQQPAINANPNPNDGLDDVDRAVLAALPLNGSVEKKAIIQTANQQTSIGVRRLGESINKLVDEGQLAVVRVPRPGKVAAVHLARVQQQAPNAPPDQQQPPAQEPVKPPEQ